MRAPLVRVALVWFGFAVGSTVNASIIFSDNGSNTIFTITQDIHFTLTSTSDDYTRFVFEDAYTVAPFSKRNGAVSSSIGIKINGEPYLGSLDTGSVWGSMNRDFGEWDLFDFGISFVETFNLREGDAVTLTAGTAILNMSADYRPDLMPTSVIMTNNTASAISSRVEIGTIPEPPTLATLALIAIGLTLRRLII